MRADLLPQQPEYRAWLGDLKARFRQVQLKAAVVVVNIALHLFLREVAIGQQAVADAVPFRTVFGERHHA